MSYGHASTIEELLKADVETIIGRLVEGVAATGISSHKSSQLLAWRREINLLKEQLAVPRFQNWYIVLEYEIPRRSRRPDAIILNGDVVYVIEFKIGAREYDAASCWQANSYALDLRDFHAETDGRRIIPILCATDATNETKSPPAFRGERTPVADLIKIGGHALGARLIAYDDTFGGPTNDPIVPEKWLSSPYRPTPTIIEAAIELYEGHGVREISHRHAHNLDRTTEMIVGEVEQARQLGRRVICFITGIPGAGKTLTGLDVVHDPGLRRSNSLAGIFLSGNGPLVKIVRAALVMSQVSQGRSKRECEHEVTTFIQNVHHFLRFHREDPEKRPHENVVVFDEAQRAWDQRQMSRKQDIDESEATLLLGVMERLPDWAVIVALVGGGQEIFRGEAGLEEWGRALEQREVSWRVVASPEVLSGGESVAGHRLFSSGVPRSLTFREEPLAHLNVGVRNHRALRWAEWVNELLDNHIEVARPLFPDTREFPCFVTRNLAAAKQWLRMHHELDSDQRVGLVATSEDLRMRAHGLERSSAFRLDYPFDKWFLAAAADVRSSCTLEVAASEFECQGLELDWVGMCWGADLTLAKGGSVWEHRKFRGTKWQAVRQEVEQVYVRNRYRVLLTRARKGLVIWVPEGDRNDPTRDAERFDLVYDTLLASGVPNLGLEMAQLTPSMAR